MCFINLDCSIRQEKHQNQLSLIKPIIPYSIKSQNLSIIFKKLCQGVDFLVRSSCFRLTQSISSNIVLAKIETEMKMNLNNLNSTEVVSESQMEL